MEVNLFGRRDKFVIGGHRYGGQRRGLPLVTARDGHSPCEKFFVGDVDAYSSTPLPPPIISPHCPSQ
jgi:hypothetical protein